MYLKMRVTFNKKKGGSSAVISFDTSLRQFFFYRICTLDWGQGAKPWFRAFTWLKLAPKTRNYFITF